MDAKNITIETFLTPIEKPQGLLRKFAYYFTRRQFGKVLTPLKVHSARLPAAFALFYAKIGKLDKKLLLPDAFFVGRTMFMHIHGRGHCDIRLAKEDRERVVAKHE